MGKIGNKCTIKKKKAQSRLQLQSLGDGFSFLPSDMDGSARLSVGRMNEWLENSHMLSPLGDAQAR